MVLGQPGLHHSCAPTCQQCRYPTTNCHCGKTTTVEPSPTNDRDGSPAPTPSRLLETEAA